MYPRPLFFQSFGMPGHQLLGSLDVAIGNVPDNFCDTARREINPYDGASLRDMHVRRRD
jgi:hypothetical protein